MAGTIPPSGVLRGIPGYSPRQLALLRCFLTLRRLSVAVPPLLCCLGAFYRSACGECKRVTHRIDLGLPGGHLEMGEEWPKCAEREVMEETGLEVRVVLISLVWCFPRVSLFLQNV